MLFLCQISATKLGRQHEAEIFFATVDLCIHVYIPTDSRVYKTRVEAILPLLDQEISQSLQEGSLSESLKQPQISTLFFFNK